MKCKMCGCELFTTADDYINGRCHNCLNGYTHNTNTFIPEKSLGWICPKCGNVYSPLTMMCWKCENIKTT